MRIPTGRGRWAARETAPPPVFGKGYTILRALRYILSFFFVVVLVPTSTLAAQDLAVFHLNGRRLAVPDSYGLSLGEIYPLLYEIDTVTVAHDGGESTIPGGDAEESFFSSRYDGDLEIASHTYRHVRSVDVIGTRLQTTTLSAWISWEGIDVIEAEIDAFGERYGVTVDTSAIANTRSKLTATERARGVPADVVMIQADYLPDLLEVEALQPLRTARTPRNGGGPTGGLIQTPISDDRYQSSQHRIDPGTASFASLGRLWAQPFYFDSHVVFYNTNLVRPAPSEDWTLADMERMARASRAEVALAWNAYSAYWLTPFVVGFGRDEIVGADGVVPVDDPATHRALEYILGLVEAGTLTVMERDAMTAYFTSGRAAMILSGSYSIPAFESLGIPFAVAPFPRVERGGRRVAPFLDFKGFAVARRAYHPILARRFIQYMTSPAVQARVTSQIAKMPADQEAWELLPPDTPYRDVLAASYRIGVPVPNERAYVVYKSLMWRMLRFAFTGQMSVDRVLEESDRLLRAASE